MIPEVEDLPVNPLNDKPKKACSCGCSEFEPEKDIMDTWATSSVTPLINLDWHDDEKFKKDMAPMSLRPNAHDIIRTWDFYTIVKSLYHTGMIPWDDVMISGHVMASKGEKISKKKGNSTMEPTELIEEFSADAVRLWTSSGSLGNDIVFSEEEFKNANKLINKIWNGAKFVVMQLEGFEKTDDNDNTVKLNAFNKDDEVKLMIMDKWIISSFNSMLKRFEKYLEKYEIGLAIGELEKFFWSFCDDYIEIIKNRVYKPEIYGEEARKSGLYAAYHTLLGMLKCFAIYIPHVTEEIYQGYFVEHEESISIHKAIIEPITTSSEIIANDFEIGDKAVKIISELRKYKSERNLSLKEDIASVKVQLEKELAFGDAIEDIKATCSCKNITLTLGDLFAVTVE